jgi:hypothetical protein
MQWKKVERVAIREVEDNSFDHIGGVSKNSFDEVGGVILDFSYRLSEGPITSLIKIGSLERNSFNPIRGVEINYDMVIRVAFKCFELVGGKESNSLECIERVSNNSSDVFEGIILKASGL